MPKLPKTKIQNCNSNILVMGLENVNVHSCMKWKVIHGAALHSVI